MTALPNKAPLTSMQKFFLMLNRVPRIEHLWNEKRRALDVGLLKKELAVMSPGECHMALFFVSIWRGDNKDHGYEPADVIDGFDLVDAVAYIDEPERNLIMEWITDPFWP